MRFEVIQRQNNFYVEVRCEYHDALTGEPRLKSRSLPMYEIQENTTALDYTKEHLRREVKRELGEQMAEFQQHYNQLPVHMHTWNMQSTGSLSNNYMGVDSCSTPAYGHTYVRLSNTSGMWNEGGEDTSPEIEIEFPLGKRILTMKKRTENGKIKVTMEDIGNAISGAKDQFKFNIITNRAERRAEDLLQSMISEIDFRNYKEKGFFTCQDNGKMYRIYKDKNKWVDLWEAKEVEAEIIWQPKNRLCTHTEKRELPDADEALSKLMLIRSGKLLEHANAHSIQGTRGLEMKPVRSESELIYV